MLNKLSGGPNSVVRAASAIVYPARFRFSFFVPESGLLPGVGPILGNEDHLHCSIPIKVSLVPIMGLLNLRGRCCKDFYPTSTCHETQASGEHDRKYCNNSKFYRDPMNGVENEYGAERQNRREAESNDRRNPQDGFLGNNTALHKLHGSVLLHSSVKSLPSHLLYKETNLEVPSDCRMQPCSHELCHPGREQIIMFPAIQCQQVHCWCSFP